MEKFTEATRVQMPALVHLTRLGYTYFGKISESMAGTVFDPCSNILLEVFRQQFCKLNPGKEKDFDQQLQEIRQQLDFDDLGRAFYKRLLAKNPRLIDFDNISNNTFHCFRELHSWESPYYSCNPRIWHNLGNLFPNPFALV